MDNVNEVVYLGDEMSKVVYCNSSGRIYVEYYYEEDKLHREDGPAVIAYYESGNKKLGSYYLNGKLHREDGPAVIAYYESGNKKLGSYYLNGKLHREDGPAVIWYSQSGEIFDDYYINGEYLTKDEFEKK